MHANDYRWDDLRVFLAILRKGSFSAAAQALDVEQSTVSRRVAALERAVGGQLFDRRTTGPVPTALGSLLAPLAEQVEGQARAVMETAASAGQRVEGRVGIAVTDSFAIQIMIPLVLDGLMAAYPQLQVDLVVDGRTADLTRREAELAIRHYRPTTGELAIKRLATLSRMAVASSEYARVHAGEPPEALDWLVQTLPGTWNVDETFVQTQLGVEPRLRTTSHLALIAAARAGLGVAVLSRGQLTLDEDLVQLELPMPTPSSVDVWLVAPTALRPVPRVAAVWNYLEACLPPILAQAVGAGEVAD